VGWVVVIGLAAWSAVASRALDEVLAASWRMLGDHLVERELGALAGQLAQERREIQRLESLRGDLVARLRRVELGPGRATVSPLRSSLDRADRVLDAAWHRAHEDEVELIALEATAAARRIDRALDAAAGDPSLWMSRATRVREYLQASDEGASMSPP
jgi:hypothetical protein